MLEAFEARLKPNQTLEDRVRAYPDPQLETKRLEIFQKMIEDTQDLLQKQLEATRPCEGHAMKLKRDEPLLDGQRSQIPPNKSKMESPRQSKSHRRRTRISKQVEITKTPKTPMHGETIQEPLQEMDGEH